MLPLKNIFILVIFSFSFIYAADLTSDEGFTDSGTSVSSPIDADKDYLPGTDQEEVLQASASRFEDIEYIPIIYSVDDCEIYRGLFGNDEYDFDRWHLIQAREVLKIQQMSDRATNFATFRIRMKIACSARISDESLGSAFDISSSGSCSSSYNTPIGICGAGDLSAGMTATSKDIILYDVGVGPRTPNDVGVGPRTPTFFASGGDESFLSELKVKLDKEIDIKSPAYYCHSRPGEPADLELRKYIAEFFDFEELLSTKGKEEIQKAFEYQIEKQDYFAEIILCKPARQKLITSCGSSLHFRLFTDKASEEAHKLGLMNKAKKGYNGWHLNDLFSSYFQLNFADSEQAIRQFINSLKLKYSEEIKDVICILPVTFLKE